MADSSIEWTKKVWNPVTGCDKVSAGCKFCYAETFSERWRGVAGHPYEQGFDLKLWPERLEMPRHWKKPQKVFVNSMSDLFHRDIPDEFIDRVFRVMRTEERHTFQVLTKRAERMMAYMQERSRNAHGIAGPWPPKNVWLGVSVEDQDAANARVPLLLQTPAAVRWVSAEPLIGPVDFTSIVTGDQEQWDALSRQEAEEARAEGACGAVLDWVVVGGESSHNARPFHLAWGRGIVGQARAAGVAVFVKQLGRRPMYELGHGDGMERYVTVDKKGGNPLEWPEDLRVREFPKP